MNKEQYQELLKILRSELKPALGCTGPIGVCYSAAQAYDAVRGGKIERIVAKLDWGFGTKIDDVAFPGTQMLGAEMAIAMGAVCGDPSLGLELLRNVTPEKELEARKVAELVELLPDWNADKLGFSADVTVYTDIGVGRAVVLERSDGLVLKERDGKVLEKYEADPSAQEAKSPMLKYSIKDMFEFALEADTSDLEIIKTAIAYNMLLAETTIKNNLGAGIGTALFNQADAGRITRAKAYAAAGCEARMSGINSPAMSCGNKGNVGIAASLPLVSLARDLKLPEEKLLRAIACSYLTAIAMIHRIGKSPAVCACEIAACLGVASGAVLLQGGTAEQADNAIQIVIPSMFGVVCDGAKLACALRISSGTGVALEAADLALAGVRIASNQGVLGHNADESIDLIGHSALFGMVDSDRELGRQLYAKRKIFPLESFEERQKH